MFMVHKHGAKESNTVFLCSKIMIVKQQLDSPIE